jgi:hypothetical protein
MITTLSPFYDRLNDPNGRMRYPSLSLSLSLNGDDVGLRRLKDNFDILLRSYLSNVVDVLDNVPATVRIL